MNLAAAKATKEWLLYLNDDMYCCPGWDQKLSDKINSIGHDACMLSGTMIEPVYTRNTCVAVSSFGRDCNTFDESGLLSKFTSLALPDWNGSTWPPSVVHRRWWDAIGGFSCDFTPGMSSDNDFSMKMWHAGCRIFLGVGDSLVYHFISKSTHKITKNNGRLQFLNKWGISQALFDRYYLQRGTPSTQVALSDPIEDLSFRWNLLRAKLKAFF